MSTFRFFYSDFHADKTIPSHRSRAVPKDDIVHSMDCILHTPRNFCGIIDDDKQTLQFMVNDDRSIRVEIPDPEKRGSYATTMRLEECLDLVRKMEDRVQPHLIRGLQFEPW